MTMLSKPEFMSKMTPFGIEKLSKGTPEPKYLQIAKSAISNGALKLMLSDGNENSVCMVTDEKVNAKDHENHTFGLIKVNNYTKSSSGTKTIYLLTNVEFLPHKFPERIYCSGEEIQQAIDAMPKKQSTPKKPTMLSSSALPSSPFSKNTHVLPVSSINAYSQTMIMKARCTEKSEMRMFKNGNGKLFSVVFVDKTGDIKATGFNDDADRLSPMLEEGKVYIISKFRAKPADQRYNKTSHSYEITFTKDTDIKLVDETDENIPKAKYNFIDNISSLNNKQKGDMVDLVAVVYNCSDVSMINVKSSGEDIAKRDVHLVDPSNMQVSLTLWKDKAENFQPPSLDETMVVAIKNAKVSDFNGRSLGAGFSTAININDMTDQKVKDMREWYESEGKDGNFIAFEKDSVGAGVAEDGTPYAKRKKRDDFLWVQIAMGMPIESEKVVAIYLGILVYLCWHNRIGSFSELVLCWLSNM
eukprot:NODE_580_length_5759_cov_0.735512.p2 type:complete len:471 gc:universal NODE_580_length_5759_cov_0.735512:2857-1445(-)